MPFQNPQRQKELTKQWQSEKQGIGNKGSQYSLELNTAQQQTHDVLDEPNKRGDGGTSGERDPSPSPLLSHSLRLAP